MPTTPTEESTMELDITHYPTYVLAQFSGPLDEHARTQFREKLHPIIGRKGARLILDLSGTPRINSPGIGNLVALVADANTQGGRVVLCALTPFVAGVMSVTKLDQFFEIAESVDEAIARVGEPAG
jgi:anti-anti-sigma factor